MIKHLHRDCVNIQNIILLRFDKRGSTFSSYKSRYSIIINAFILGRREYFWICKNAILTIILYCKIFENPIM